MSRDSGSAGARAPERGPWWWAALVIPLWATLALCAHWEPVMRDGWGHLDWYRAGNRLGFGSLYAFYKEAYAAENPRLGQVFTLMSYAPGPYHAIVTPLVELGALGLLTALALGRWPRVRSADDARDAALVTAVVLACAPQVGALLCYRPFVGNYTWGLALNLLWLVPYRFERVEARPRRDWLAPLWLALGVAAGLCNEHTGLAVGGLGALASIEAARRRRLRPWMIAGVVGLAAGYVLLLTAPGQHVRYAGLADQAGIAQRIAERGVAGNLRVLGFLALALLPALPVVAIGLHARRTAPPARAEGGAAWVALALAGLACTATLLASPKLGPRLYLASVALIAAGLVGWLRAQVTGRGLRRGLAVLAVATIALVEVRLVTIHRAVGPLGVVRRDRIEHGAPGSVVHVPPYPYGSSRYFLGDDFLVASLRQAIAGGYGLAGLELEGAAGEP
jgi:hypothetical protein